MRAAAAWAARRLGLRGAALLLTGIGWLTYGIGIVIDPRAGVGRGVVVLTYWAPLPWWGILWLACGATAVLGAWSPAGRDIVSFAAAAFPPLIWSGAYLTALLTGRYPTAWTSIPAWWVPIALLLCFAALSRQAEAMIQKIASLTSENDNLRQQIRDLQGAAHE